MRVLTLTLALLCTPLMAQERILFTDEHCEALAQNNHLVAKLRDEGEAMELVLAKLVYARQLAEKKSLLYETIPFIYQWTPVVYEGQHWSAKQIYAETKAACMVFEGKRLVVPKME